MTQEEIFIEVPFKEGSTIKKLVLTVDGYYLTCKDRQDNQEVILSKEVILGKTDSRDNWCAIPIEEGDAIMAQWQAEQERKMQEEDARMQEEMNNEQ